MATAANWRPGLPAPAESDIVQCVACGLCLPHCPTFRVTGRETASPRGRIAAMRAVDEGVAEVEGTFTTMMDECLACRACEAVCPSGVPFGRMIEAARAQIEPTRPPQARGVKKLGLTQVLARPRVMRLLGVGLALTQALKLDALIPRRLRSSTPRVRLRGLLRPLRSRGRGPSAVLLTGCIMDVAFRHVHRATLRALAGAGYRAVVPERGGCCGALAMHYGLPEAAKRMARARIEDFEHADLVVVNSAGCGAHLRAYGELFADDAEWAERAEAVAGKVRDVIELEHPARPGASIGRVAVHDACHHLHAQRIAAQPRAMLRAAGAELCELDDGGRCCGAAGLYSVTQPELSSELRRQKAEKIAAAGAPVVSVANPGCAIQIAEGLREIGSDVRVVHPAELTAPARGDRS